MARRKVTMLEAFQRSARESAERVASERRRVIAEREKEIRRAETARTAQEFSTRLSQRAGDSVGSLLAGIRGAAAAPPEADAEATAPELDAAPSADVPVVDAPDITTVPAVAAPELSPKLSSGPGPARSGPALPAFDRAVHAELPDVSSTRSSRTPSVTSSTASATPGTDPEEEPREQKPFADASHEEVEEAIAALETEVFELPMSSKTFALLGLAAVLAVFSIGYSFGSRGESSSDGGRGLARVGLPAGSSGIRSLGSGQARTSPSEPSWSAGTTAGDVGAPPVSDEGISGVGAPSHEASAGGAPVAQGEAAATVPALTAEDLTFRNAEMNFTILAITYSRTEAHAKLAMETYDYLYGEGFPVIHPIEKDSRLFLFVGAAKSMGELENLQQELKDLRSGQSRDARPFRSAYLVNIDPYR